jgi:hypothetical protein
MTNATNEPVFKASIGLINVAVWENIHNDKAFYSVDIIRSYKDKDGEWQKASSFGHEDLLNIAKLAERAESFIARQKQG